MNHEHFETMPPKRLFIKLAIPSLISMLFSSLYMMVDGMFVGKLLGSTALAAINLVFPIIMIVFALGDMIASGTAVKIGIHLGEKKEEKASEYFTLSLIVIFLLNSVLMLLSLLFVKTIIFTLIKDISLAKLAHRFANIFIYSLPFIAPFFAIDNYLRVCGKAKLSMWINIIVSVLNIILDAIFIGYLKLGIEYAALASAFSMFIGALVSIYPFIRRKVVLKFTRPRISAKEMLEIIYNGSSEFFSNISGSIMSIIINSFLLRLGGAVAVAAYSIVIYIESIIIPLIFAMIDSVQPVISYNYGSDNRKRIFTFFKITCITSFVVSLITMAVIFLFPDFLVGLFSEKSDYSTIKMAKNALFLYAPSYLFVWFSMIVSGFLTALEKATYSIVLMFVDSILLPLLLIVILPSFMGVYGIFFIPTVSGAISAMIAFILWRKSCASFK